MSERLQVGLAAVAFAATGLVTLAFALAGDGTYASLVSPGGAVVRVDGEPRTLDVAALRASHRATLAYVFGDSDVLPDVPGTAAPLFAADERAHMADVRTVFGGARAVQLVGAAVLAALVVAWRRAGARVSALRLRSAILAATAATAVLALLAAVAFEPLFLAFHLVFFPQGNFLFAPDSNLIAVYPERYWEGVTLRVGAAFVALAVALAGGATAYLRAVHPPRSVDSPR